AYASLGSRAALLDIADHGALGLVQSYGFGHVIRHGTDLHADAATGYLAMFFKLLDHTHDFVDGDGQGNTHEATALGNNLGIPPGHMPGQIDQRPTRVARIDSHIGLYEGKVVTGIAIDGAGYA